MPRVSAILLAAGESTRMGRQKALLAWQGETLINYQLRQFSGIDAITEVIVVTGHEPDAIRATTTAWPKARAVHNSAYRTGKVSSILAGVAAVPANADAILLLSVDQPRPAELLRRVIDAHFEARGLISAAAHDGHRGHPVVFDRSLLSELRGIIEASEGIRAIMLGHAADVRDVECGAEALVDLNTPADYDRDGGESRGSEPERPATGG
jgi:molybdenum cofactor cytidylyltransferase